MSFEILNKKIADEFEIELSAIIPQADMRTVLSLDSFSALNLVVIVQHTCGITIPIRQLPKFTTFGSLYEYIEQQKDGDTNK